MKMRSSTGHRSSGQRRNRTKCRPLLAAPSRCPIRASSAISSPIWAQVRKMNRKNGDLVLTSGESLKNLHLTRPTPLKMQQWTQNLRPIRFFCLFHYSHSTYTIFPACRFMISFCSVFFVPNHKLTKFTISSRIKT